MIILSSWSSPSSPLQQIIINHSWIFGSFPIYIYLTQSRPKVPHSSSLLSLPPQINHSFTSKKIPPQESCLVNSCHSSHHVHVILLLHNSLLLLMNPSSSSSLCERLLEKCWTMYDEPERSNRWVFPMITSIPKFWQCTPFRPRTVAVSRQGLSNRRGGLNTFQVTRGDLFFLNVFCNNEEEIWEWIFETPFVEIQ